MKKRDNVYNQILPEKNVFIKIKLQTRYAAQRQHDNLSCCSRMFLFPQLYQQPSTITHNIEGVLLMSSLYYC